MRLLLLTIDFPPARGGVQGLLACLADGLAATAEVTVVTGAAAGTAAWDRARRYTVVRARPAGWGRPAGAGLQLRALVEILRRRPDVVVCGHVLLGPVCRLAHALRGVPYVAFVYAYEIRAPRMQRLTRLALGGARRVIALSDFGRRAAQAHGVPPGRVAVLRPGAVLDAVGGGNDALEPGARVVLSVGRLVDAYKGHDMAIRAMPLILARVSAARYVVVGGGPRRSYLERLAAALGVAGAVRFVGEIADDEVDRWYRRCDVFLLPAREDRATGGAEGYGIVCVEAGLRGKPVVAGRSGGIPDAVIDGETGVLVDPLDPAEIADAVTRLLTEPDLAARLGRGGRRRASEDLAWPHSTGQLVRLLTEVAAE